MIVHRAGRSVGDRPPRTREDAGSSPARSIIPNTALLETTTIKASTVTVTETITTIKTESLKVSKSAPGITETVTTTVAQGVRLKVYNRNGSIRF